MRSDLRDIINDTLEVKFCCNRRERAEILRFLRHQNGFIRESHISHVHGFSVGDMVICLSHESKRVPQKFVYWNLHTKQRVFVGLDNRRRLVKPEAVFAAQ